jgi:hypothetical protein
MIGFMKRTEIIVLLFIGIISNIHADNSRYIAIEHIGDENRIVWTIVINTHKEGFEIIEPFGMDGFEVYFDEFGIPAPIPINLDYCNVQESTFNEIINLININIELFGNRNDFINAIIINADSGISDLSTGLFKLHIQNDAEKCYYYLFERKSSAIFFVKLYELIIEIEGNNRLVSKLINNFRYFRFMEFNSEIGGKIE